MPNTGPESLKIEYLLNAVYAKVYYTEASGLRFSQIDKVLSKYSGLIRVRLVLLE